MTKKYYVDTCIWRDYYENRKNLKGKDIGEIASRMFIKILIGKELIVCSELVIRELRKDYDDLIINQIFSIFMRTNKLENVDIDNNDIIMAKNISRERKTSFPDTLHAVLSRKSFSELVTRNIKDFKNLNDITHIIRPEELLDLDS